jgi:hypothetical protein
MGRLRLSKIVSSSSPPVVVRSRNRQTPSIRSRLRVIVVCEPSGRFSSVNRAKPSCSNVVTNPFGSVAEFVAPIVLHRQLRIVDPIGARRFFRFDLAKRIRRASSQAAS